MFTLNKLPEDETVRLYSALALAAVMLESFYTRHRIKPTDKVPSGAKLYIDGRDSDSIRYLWTALMWLAPNPNFSKSCITVGEKCAFNPDAEFNWRGKWRSKSLHESVFKPSLADKEVTFDPEERKKPFGHQAPTDEVARAVLFYAGVEFIIGYFDCIEDTRTVAFRYSDNNLADLKAMGSTKLATALPFIAREKADTIKLNRLYAAETFGLGGCKALLTYCKTVKRVDFSENRLSQLGLAGIKAALSCLPYNVEFLSLRANGLEKFSESELKEIMGAIPLTVSEVKIDYNDLSNDLEIRVQAYRKNLIEGAKNTLQEPKVTASIPSSFQQKTSPIQPQSSSGYGFYSKPNPVIPGGKSPAPTPTYGDGNSMGKKLF